MSSALIGQKDIHRRQYIATQVFNTAIYAYSNYVDPVTYATRGSLVPHPSATAATCKAGHILRETGKKLLSTQNPDMTYGGNTFTYLVGVFDANTGLNGFIDPNSPSFAVYNSDKSPFLNIPTEATDGATGLQNLGAPVYTRGSVLSLSGIGFPSGVGAGGTVAQLTSKSTAVTLNAPTGQITTTNAQLNTLTSVAFQLNNSYISAGDMILVQYVSGSSSPFNYRVFADPGSAGYTAINIYNTTAVNLSEALVLKFVVIKASTT